MCSSDLSGSPAPIVPRVDRRLARVSINLRAFNGAAIGRGRPQRRLVTNEIFRFLKRRIVHEWGVWSLVTDHFEGDQGLTFARTLLTTPGAVAIVATDSKTPDCNVVLVHQFRASVRKFCWEIPAGMCDVVGEPPRLTAERELMEIGRAHV